MKIPFASHLGTKLMALVLAVFLWSFAYLENLKEETITYVISIGAPAGLKIEPPTQPIDVQVRGPRKIVEPLRGEPEIYIKKEITQEELEQYGDQDSVQVPVTVTAEDLNADPALTFLNLPRRIQVTLRRIDARRLPVQLRVTGTPKPGYVYLPSPDSYSWPREVSVTGPKSLLDETAHVQTREIDITGLSESFKLSVTLDNRINGETVNIADSRVEVYIRIEQQQEEKSLDVPIQAMAPSDYPYALNPDRATAIVTLEGPGEIISGLDAGDVRVYYDVDDTMEPNEVPWPVDLKAWVPEHPDVTATLQDELLNVKVEPASP